MNLNQLLCKCLSRNEIAAIMLHSEESGRLILLHCTEIFFHSWLILSYNFGHVNLIVRQLSLNHCKLSEIKICIILNLLCALLWLNNKLHIHST